MFWIGVDGVRLRVYGVRVVRREEGINRVWVVFERVRIEDWEFEYYGD